MEDRWFTDRRVGTRFPLFTRGNAADVLPEPVSPLGWTLLWEGAISPGARDGFIDFGLVDWDEFETPDDPECFGLFGGYFYNPLSIVRLMGARLPGASPEAIDRAYFDPRPDIPPYVAEPWHESEKHSKKLAESLGWVMFTESFEAIDEEKRLADRLREERPDLSKLWDGALLARARARCCPISCRCSRRRSGRRSGPPWGPVRSAPSPPTSAIRRSRSASSAASRSTRPSPPSPCGSSLGWLAARTTLGAMFADGVHGLARASAPVGRARCRGLLPGLRSVRARLRLSGPERVGPASRSWETNPELALAAIDRMTAGPTTHRRRRPATTDAVARS